MFEEIDSADVGFEVPEFDSSDNTLRADLVTDNEQNQNNEAGLEVMALTDEMFAEGNLKGVAAAVVREFNSATGEVSAERTGVTAGLERNFGRELSTNPPENVLEAVLDDSASPAVEVTEISESQVVISGVDVSVSDEVGDSVVDNVVVVDEEDEEKTDDGFMVDIANGLGDYSPEQQQLFAQGMMERLKVLMATNPEELTNEQSLEIENYQRLAKQIVGATNETTEDKTKKRRKWLGRIGMGIYWTLYLVNELHTMQANMLVQLGEADAKQQT